MVWEAYWSSQISWIFTTWKGSWCIPTCERGRIDHPGYTHWWLFSLMEEKFLGAQNSKKSLHFWPQRQNILHSHMLPRKHYGSDNSFQSYFNLLRNPSPCMMIISQHWPLLIPNLASSMHEQSTLISDTISSDTQSKMDKLNWSIVLQKTWLQISSPRLYHPQRQSNLLLVLDFFQLERECWNTSWKLARSQLDGMIDCCPDMVTRFNRHHTHSYSWVQLHLLLW